MTLHPIAPDFAGDDLLGLSAVEQARRIRTGELSSAELVDAYLSRIAHHDDAVGALVRVFARAARRDALRADRERARRQFRGPFHGVPTAMKDHHLVRGTRTGFGSRAFSWVWSPADDVVVSRVRQAGFVFVGKTAMSELGLLPIVETDVHPPTRNPWDRSRTAGGSSGGAGAAVAAGLLPIAPGSDGAGSVRIPASLNGLIGLKPTRDLVPTPFGGSDPFGLTAIGPLARCVDDAAALLDVLAGTGATTFAERSTVRVPGLRIGFITTSPFGPVEPRILAQVEAAARRLEAAGHTIEPRPCPDGSVEEFMPVYQRFIARIPVASPARLQPVVRWFHAEGRAVSLDDALTRYHRFEARGLAAMDGLDLLLSPTVPILAPKVGAFAHLPPRDLFEAAAPLGAFTALANVTGQPAISVPVGLVDGLPVGAQLVGHRGRDALLLAVARQIEGA